MRKRKEIEHSYKAPISCSPRGFEEIKIELLLDIRDLLASQPKPCVFLTPTQAVDELRDEIREAIKK